MYSVKRARAGTFLRSHRRMRPSRALGTCTQPHACHSRALSVQSSAWALLIKTKTKDAQQTTDEQQTTHTSGSSRSFWSMLATNLPRSWSSSGFSSCTSRVTSWACNVYRTMVARGSEATRAQATCALQRVHHMHSDATGVCSIMQRVHHLPRPTGFWSMRTPGMYRSRRTAWARW